MQIPHDTLVLVADGRKYLFLRNEGDETYPVLKVEGHATQSDRPTHEQGTDTPGRAFASVGGMRSAVEETDYQQLEEDRFAAEAAGLLCKRAQSGHYESLIVVAPPRTLGELRKHYDKSVEARLIGEVDKDLTKHPLPEIETILKG